MIIIVRTPEKSIIMTTNISETVEFQARENGYNRRIHTFAIVDKLIRIDIVAFLKDAFQVYEPELDRVIRLHNMIKSATTLTVEYEKKIPKVNTSVNVDDDSPDNLDSDEIIKITRHYPSPTVLIGLDSDVEANYQINIIDELLKCVENDAMQGSGFTLSRIVELNVQISSYEPLRGSAYIPTPKRLERKHAIINVQNKNDDMCFKWAVLAALNKDKIKTNPQRVQNYKPFENDLNFDGIKNPVSIKDINQFVKQNDNISINVYYYDESADQVYPLRVSDTVKVNHIHLLLLIKRSRINTNEGNTLATKISAELENEQILSHYCWIKDLSRLVSSQLSKHGHKSFICDRCLNYFQTKEFLTRHSTNCQNEYQVEMPTENNKWIQFENQKNQLKAPFIVYADTEAFLKRLDAEEQTRVFNPDCKTRAYQEHKVYSVGYYFKCAYDDNESYYASSNDPKHNPENLDCIQWFVEQLKTLAIYAARKLSQNVPIEVLSSDDERLFNNPNTLCHICEMSFEKGEKRVRDHCHATGEYRGPAHVKCNLNYQESRTLPVVMHNLSGYDAHLFIKKLATQIDGDTSIIPNNMEQYISFSKVVAESVNDKGYKQKIRLKFIDSCRFMPASLSNLASLIPASKKRILYAEGLKEYSLNQIAMLERKGVFPYDYVDCLERLDETSLPTKEQFHSELNDESLDDDEYIFACEIWNNFNIKTLREYSELYLKTDVLLLADVFENFRETCHSIYELDPAHYYTAPGLSFDAMLRYTGVKIELLTDIEMLLFIERGIRGGISQCNKRHVKANNKYMGDAYKPEEKNNFLMYLDGEFISFYFIH